MSPTETSPQRPEYYERIAPRFRQHDLDDPAICYAMIQLAQELRNELSAFDSMRGYYVQQETLLTQHYIHVSKQMDTVVVTPPAEAVVREQIIPDPVPGSIVAMATLCVLGAVLFILKACSSMGQMLALA